MSGPRHYRGFCRIPYARTLQGSMVTGAFANGDDAADAADGLTPVFEDELTAARMSLTETFNDDGTIEFDYELDLEFDEFEEFELPELSRGRYLHDFRVNKTAIVDADGGRCFVMDLDRAEVK